ncbi:MAG TPA: sensor histidine kinase, partial [Bacteroidota bacterium]
LNCLVPPLILQPLVENAVNHGIAHLLQGGTIRLHAQRTGARLTIIVENPCDPERPRQSGSGLGLENIKNRLRALHRSDARLDVAEEGNQFRAELSLPALEQPSR